ncbi:hypothetical protein JXM67_01095 [candidate division WOR-3 bacterium]|nr:hypothetical protein [candidate division WOR-3 bacterium]
MKKLAFFENGICNICLEGLPEALEIENIIEEYVLNVELLPNPLKLIFIDISGLVHMGVRSRQVFSELLIQASRHYEGKIELIVAGGSLNLRRYIQLFCKGIGFRERSHIFATLEEAQTWIESRFGKEPSVENTAFYLKEQTA